MKVWIPLIDGMWGTEVLVDRKHPQCILLDLEYLAREAGSGEQQLVLQPSPKYQAEMEQPCGEGSCYSSNSPDQRWLQQPFVSGSAWQRPIAAPDGRKCTFYSGSQRPIGTSFSWLPSATEWLGRVLFFRWRTEMGSDVPRGRSEMAFRPAEGTCLQNWARAWGRASRSVAPRRQQHRQVSLERKQGPPPGDGRRGTWYSCTPSRSGIEFWIYLSSRQHSSLNSCWDWASSSCHSSRLPSPWRRADGEICTLSRYFGTLLHICSGALALLRLLPG